VILSGGDYTLYYGGFSSGIRQIGTATSTDGIHWTKTGTARIPKSQWDASFNKLDGLMKVGGIFLATYTGYSLATNDQIGFATSTDGVTWTPYPGNPVITCGTGSWDTGAVFDSFILTVASNYYVYYTGWNNKTYSNSRDQIGLAILPASQYPIPEYPSAQLMMITAILTTAILVTIRKTPSNTLEVQRTVRPLQFHALVLHNLGHNQMTCIKGADNTGA
jgi:predicted GH43/DUF377 family glycosyl hydrolase